MKQLTNLIQEARTTEATDLHLTAGAIPALRVKGQIKKLQNTAPFEAETLENALQEKLTEKEVRELERAGALDTSIVVDGKRARTHIFRDAHGLNAALRLRKSAVSMPQELNLPPAFVELTGQSSGLILIAGPTGAGKTTTRASLIEHINQTSGKHVISLSDTIEHDFTEKQSVIHQRAIGDGKHAVSYEDAMADALRQDPDIITLGDLRDRKAMNLALLAAQTGHLIIAEVHAHTTEEALSRILAETQHLNSYAQHIFADQFAGAIAQRLIYSTDDADPILATELLLSNEAVKSRIRGGRIKGMEHTMRSNHARGMHTLEDFLNNLIADEKITKDEAQEHLKQ